MEYSTNYDIGDRKRGQGINEDSLGLTVFEQGHREGYAGREREDGRPQNRSTGVFVLADGAGGHDAGDAASYIATTVVTEELADLAVRAARSKPDDFDVAIDEAVLPERPSAGDLQTAVAEAIETAHREIIRYAAESGEQAYTTVVAGVAVGGYLHYGWVGDSRAYVLNEAREELSLLTKDHAVVQEWADAGEVDDVAAHVHPKGNEITRALGGSGYEDPERASVEVETRSVPLYAEDVVLVTSDGLIDAQTDAPALYERYVEADRSEEMGEAVLEAVVTDDDIRETLLAADSLDAAATEFVDVANERGGKDNLSVLLFRDPALPETPTEGGIPERDIDPDTALEDRETVIHTDE
jgi:serine/threonine protein phosphatase PrpC